MAQLKKSQRGFIVTVELLLLATILVIGLIVGMASLRDSILAELSDASESIGALNQSYNILGANNAANTAATGGSEWQDNFDTGGPFGGTIDDPNQTGDAGDATAGDLGFVVGGDEQTPVLP